MNWKTVPSVRWLRVPLALAAIGLQPAAAQIPVEAGGPYLHRDAAAVFPVQVGEFRRAEVYRYDEDGRDISASYNLATPEGRLLVTAYIYPAPAAARDGQTELCEREFESAKDAIQSQHGGAPIEEGRGLAVSGTQRALRHRAAYRLTMNFDQKLQPVRSEARLYCYVGGNWFVKYRVSAPVAVTMPEAVEAFIRAGPWPGRSSPETVAWLDPVPRRGTPLTAQR
jgi:hypothetical protein